jgi:uncharacterized protein (DUF1499 family)
MGLIRWFTKNWANTSEPTHRDLCPVSVAAGVDEAQGKVKQAIENLRNWRVESETPGELKLSRRTGVIGFVDDVTVTVEPAVLGALIHASSRSRVGVGDFGQNRRNILELWAALRTLL